MNNDNVITNTEILFFRIFRDVFLKSKIFKEIYNLNRFKRSYSYDISNVYFMLTNGYTSLLNEKLDNIQQQNISTTHTKATYLQFDNESLKIMGSINEFQIFKKLLNYWNSNNRIKTGIFDKSTIPKYIYGNFIDTDGDSNNSNGNGNQHDISITQDDSDDDDSEHQDNINDSDEIDENEDFDDSDNENLFHVVIGNNRKPIYMETIPRSEKDRLEMYTKSDELLLDGLLKYGVVENLQYYFSCQNVLELDYELLYLKLLNLQYQLPITSIKFIFESIFKEYPNLIEKYWIYQFDKISTIASKRSIVNSKSQEILLYLIQFSQDCPNKIGNILYYASKNSSSNGGLLDNSKIKEISFEFCLLLNKYNLLPKSPMDLLNFVFCKFKYISIEILEFINIRLGSEKFIKSKELSIVNLISRILINKSKKFIYLQSTNKLLWYLIDNGYYLPNSFLFVCSFYGEIELVKKYFEIKEKETGSNTDYNEFQYKIALNLSVLCGLPKCSSPFKILPKFDISIDINQGIDIFENELFKFMFDNYNGDDKEDHKEHYKDPIDSVEFYTLKNSGGSGTSNMKYYNKSSIDKFIQQIYNLKRDLIKYEKLLKSRDNDKIDKHIQIVQLLLSKGFIGHSGIVVGQACFGGCEKIVQLLFLNPTIKESTIKSNNNQLCPIKIAIRYNHYDILKLLSNEIPSKIKNSIFELQYPLIFGNFQIIKLIISQMETTTGKLKSKCPILFSACCSNYDIDNLEIILYLHNEIGIEIMDRDIIYSILCGGSNDVIKYLYSNRKQEISQALLASCFIRNWEIVDLILDSVDRVGQYISDNNNNDIKVLLCNGDFNYVEKILHCKLKFQNNGTHQTFSPDLFSIPFINGHFKAGELFLRSSYINWQLNQLCLGDTQIMVPILYFCRKEIISDQILYNNGCLSKKSFSDLTLLDLTRIITVNYHNSLPCISKLLYYTFSIGGLKQDIAQKILNILIFQSDLYSLELLYIIPGFKKYFDWSLFQYSIKFQNLKIISSIFEKILPTLSSSSSSPQPQQDDKLFHLFNNLVEDYIDSNSNLINLFKSFKLILKKKFINEANNNNKRFKC